MRMYNCTETDNNGEVIDYVCSEFDCLQGVKCPAKCNPDTCKCIMALTSKIMERELIAKKGIGYMPSC